MGFLGPDHQRVHNLQGVNEFLAAGFAKNAGDHQAVAQHAGQAVNSLETALCASAEALAANHRVVNNHIEVIDPEREAEIRDSRRNIINTRDSAGLLGLQARLELATDPKSREEVGRGIAWADEVMGLNGRPVDHPFRQRARALAELAR